MLGLKQPLANKLVYIILVLLVFSLTISGCSVQELFGKKQKNSASNGKTDQKPVIALALDRDNPNRLLLKQGIADMAKEAEMEVKEISAQNGSQDGQESPLQGAKVLIVQGGGSNQALIQSAVKDNIPILALDRIPSGAKPAGIILPDPENRGKAMAELLLTKVNEGNIVVMLENPDDSISQQILAGIQQVISKNPKLKTEIIASPEGTESVARFTLTQILRQGRDIQGIVAVSERLAAQAHETLKQENLKEVALVGGEANLESLKRIAGGQQIGDIDTSPYIQGVNAFQWAEKIMNKQALDVMDTVTGDQGEVPAKIIPVKAVTSENLSVVQKSYQTTMSLAQQEESAQQANQGQGSKNGDSQSKLDQQVHSNRSQGEQGQDQQAQGQQGQGQANIPQGAKQIREKIKTEITREYLDENGKVLGTETSTSHQERTIPPEMLQNSQQGQGGQDQGGQSGGGGQGDQGGGQGGGGSSGDSSKMSKGQ